MKNNRHSSRALQLSMLVAFWYGVGCGGDDTPTGVSPQSVTAGQSGGAAGQSGLAGREATVGPMPGLGMMMMAGTSGRPMVGAAGSGQAAAGAPGVPGTGGNGGQAGLAGIGGTGPQAGGPSAAGAGAAGSAGAAGNAGAAGGGGTTDGMDATSVCAGGKVGMDSDAVMTRDQTSRRNLAVVMFTVPPPTKIVNFKTTLLVPKTPSQRATLFIWPGLQHMGGADPGRIGNGVLQPVLTWGPSCSTSAPSDSYASWWISAMYVNISTSAAGPSGCANGDSMKTAVGDRLFIEFAESGTEWIQTVTNLANMEKVDLTWDLEGQDQNWAIWDIETPSSSRPAEDTVFEKSVLTFSAPVETCQPQSAAEVDYFSAPVLSPDGLHCCYDKIILKSMRN